MSTAMPSWRSCSCSTDETRSRRWPGLRQDREPRRRAGRVLEHAVAVAIGQADRREQLARLRDAVEPGRPGDPRTTCGCPA